MCHRFNHFCSTNQINYIGFELVAWLYMNTNMIALQSISLLHALTSFHCYRAIEPSSSRLPAHVRRSRCLRVHTAVIKQTAHNRERNPLFVLHRLTNYRYLCVQREPRHVNTSRLSHSDHFCTLLDLLAYFIYPYTRNDPDYKAPPRGLHVSRHSIHSY